jgi:Holliday junction resolvasome RuvABC endonuclease subunit
VKHEKLLEERMREFATGKQPKPAPDWTPPTLEDFATGLRVQAFDQTLGSTGYVQVEVDEWIDGRTVKVWAKDTIRPKPDPSLRSFVEKYDRQYLLAGELTKIIQCTDPVIYEMPAVHGWETESSLLAGSAVYDVTMENQGRRPVMISKNHVGSVLCNDSNAKKPEIRKALARYLPEVAERSWNEHTRDALALALTYLYDAKRFFDGH